MERPYLIIYEAASTSRKPMDIENIVEDISSYWCHNWESVWLVRSPLSPDEIADQIAQHIADSDHLLVIEVKDNKQGRLLKKDWNFINEKIFQ